MSDRDIAKRIFQRFRGDMDDPDFIAPYIIDILIKMIRAERERCANRVEGEMIPGCDKVMNPAIKRAAAAVRKGGNDA